MSKKNDVSSEDDADFVLKHRVTGAAFLIVFGVLFLPWVLSGPSQSNQANAEPVDLNSEQASREDIEQELLAAIENENVVEQDLEIYVSRITPLDAQTSDTDSTATSSNDSRDTEKTEVTAERPAEVAQSEQKPVVVKLPEEEVREEPKEEVVEKTIELKPEQVEPEKTQQPTNTVDVGWVVQVGVFTDSKGAAKVVADLKGKGFEPSTTIVDTNLGKATGTRVWLGPYSQRVDAAKSKTTLKDKTGGDGFIRAYP